MADGRNDGKLYAALGEQIRRARQQREMSQDELGKAVGLTRGSVANIEHGRQRFMVHTLVDISRILEVDVTSLLETQSPNVKPLHGADLIESASIRRDGARAFVQAALSGARKQH